MHGFALPQRPVGRIAAALLYGVVLLAASACTSTPQSSTPPLILKPVPTPTPVVTPTPEAAVTTPLAPVAPVEDIKKLPPHIAVLLPLDAPRWQRVAGTVKEGLLAAERTLASGQTPPLRFVDTDDDAGHIAAAFNRVLKEGAVGVIGPQSREAITLIADQPSIGVPVIALNAFSDQTLRRPNLYSFQLSLDADAEQTARWVRGEGIIRPIILMDDGQLATRIAQGFVKGWRDQTGQDPAIVPIDMKQLGRLRANLDGASADAVFLAMDSKSARRVRPYLGQGLAIYATSLAAATSSTAAVDLAGIRYLEAPWLANPDDPTYVFYDRKRSSSAQLELLFAQGVDAWRLVQALQTRPADQVKLESGLTGQLSIDADGTVQRQLVTRTVELPLDLPAPPQ
ncbi:penicillin-binding protein activator [Chitinibacteraceae bacterium HSL-7]